MTQLDTWNEVALPRIMLLRQRMEKDGDNAETIDRAVHLLESLFTVTDPDFNHRSHTVRSTLDFRAATYLIYRERQTTGEHLRMTFEEVPGVNP